MNLTVGPLPPAVYWRRRAIIIGALLLVVILLVSMCGGSGKPTGARNTAAHPSGGTTPSTDPSGLAPIIGEGGDGGGDTTTTTDPAATTPPPATSAGGDGGTQPSASGPCADADLSLTAVATPLAKGFYFSMKVRNVSSRACSRDVGAGPQALQVVNASGAVVWSSDLCAAAGRSPQPDVRTFGPNIETVLPPRPFYWDGTLGRCSGGTAPGPGNYRLVARLATKTSQPVAVVGK